MRKYEIAHPIHTQVLLQSLLEAPLLVGDLESSTLFNRKFLGCLTHESEGPELNYCQKLGHLYEDALSYLLENAEGEIPIDVLGISVQIFNENKITQGELDYLLKVGERTIHLELAVKFYLIHEQDGVTTFPGPDPRDNWDSKLNKLESHQLKMASSKYGKKHLLDNYGVENVEVQHLIYGKIFDHFSKLGTREIEILPRAVSGSTVTYPWIHISEWDEYLGDESVKFIPKHLWPVGRDQYDIALIATLPVVDKHELIASIAEYHCCLMIWSTQHLTTIFLVPNHWPSVL